MKVEVRTDFGDGFKKLNLDATDGTRMANAAMRGMNKYVPVDTGLLQRSATVQPFKVTYPVEYASYAYNPPRGRIHTYPNPTATAKWAEVYEAAGAKEIVEEVGRIIDGK